MLDRSTSNWGIDPKRHGRLFVCSDICRYIVVVWMPNTGGCANCESGAKAEVKSLKDDSLINQGAGSIEALKKRRQYSWLSLG